MMKRNVEYMGLDCAADKMDPMYMHYKMLLQKQIPWASQTKYAKYTVYFGVAVILLLWLNIPTIGLETSDSDRVRLQIRQYHSLMY